MSTNNTETPGAATPGEPLANIWEQLKQLDVLRKERDAFIEQAMADLGKIQRILDMLQTSTRRQNPKESSL